MVVSRLQCVSKGVKSTRQKVNLLAPYLFWPIGQCLYPTRMYRIDDLPSPFPRPATFSSPRGASYRREHNRRGPPATSHPSHADIVQDMTGLNGPASDPAKQDIAQIIAAEPALELPALCAQIHARLNAFLETEPATDRIRSVQDQSRTSLKVIEEALSQYRYASPPKDFPHAYTTTRPKISAS